jgi:hypothetical protein
MSIKTKISTLALVVSVILLATGCQQEPSPVSPAVDSPRSDIPGLTAEEKSTLYPVLSEVTSGTSKVTFYDAGDGSVFMTQLFDAGRNPLVDESMDGLTFAEIHSRLAPGKPVPALLAKNTFRIAAPVEHEFGPVEAAPLLGEPGAPLGKVAGQWDLWFQQNYCDDVNQCLLNRTGSSTDWVQSTNRKYSVFWVMLYQGSQITTKIKVDGNTVVTGTVLYGQVWSGWGQSGTNWLGAREKKTHRLEISDGSGDGWHIAAWYL